MEMVWESSQDLGDKADLFTGENNGDDGGQCDDEDDGQNDNYKKKDTGKAANLLGTKLISHQIFDDDGDDRE